MVEGEKNPSEALRSNPIDPEEINDLKRILVKAILESLPPPNDFSSLEKKYGPSAVRRFISDVASREESVKDLGDAVDDLAKKQSEEKSIIDIPEMTIMVFENRITKCFETLLHDSDFTSNEDLEVKTPEARIEVMRSLIRRCFGADLKDLNKYSPEDIEGFIGKISSGDEEYSELIDITDRRAAGKLDNPQIFVITENIKKLIKDGLETYIASKKQ